LTFNNKTENLIMMKNIKIYTLILAGLLFIISACVKDLDTVPLDKDEITSANVYENPASYYQVLAKVYAGLAVSGQQGPHGMPDISGIDEGFSTYIRQYWKAQELTTDEAIIAWNDGNLRDYHDMDWSATNEFISAMYNRIYYQISLCNEFIRESGDDKLDERGITGDDKTNIMLYRAEARFMRALSYYHALDMFGSVPFVTEEDAVGSFFPDQISKDELFVYIESELKDIENDLAEPRANEYGRADKAAAWTLLAKLYLNAEIYINSAKYTECVEYSDKVIAAGYSLSDDYQHLFLADNHTSDEIIFPVTFDGVHTKTWGGMTFLVHAAIGGTMDPAEFGVDGGWGGTRTTKSFVKKFYPDIEGSLKVSPTPPLKSTTYPVIYVPGAHQGWDPTNTSTVLASVNSDGNYEGYLYFPDDETQFKFTDGPAWDVNYGDVGADGTLDLEGDNIVAGDAGYYYITVNLNDLTYTLLKTDWGIIGSATAGGWDSDQDMTFDVATGLWTAVIDLTGGAEMKFRANDDWTLNYGDNGPDGILNLDGSNIAIANSGSYVVTMKLGVPDYTYTIVRGSFDKRAMFHTDGQTLDITDIFEFTEGYAIGKYKNVTSAGATGSDLAFPDNDFPMFRLAEIYLMYAEAVLRGGGGSESSALGYINDLRTRAYGDDSGNISANDLTVDFILDERARELYWEGHRRTDLIRYNKFTGSEYIWPWKGNDPEGIAVDAKYNIFPIPSSDIGANPNLIQNSGY